MSIGDSYISCIGIYDVGIIHILFFVGILIGLTIAYIKTNISQETIVNSIIEAITYRKVISFIAQYGCRRIIRITAYIIQMTTIIRCEGIGKSTVLSSGSTPHQITPHTVIRF
ncbi:hypothetical protein D3C72_1713240 [compost metagenome]